MAAPVHTSEVLARFQDGETRLVYARHRDRPEDTPYYLEDGTARSVRAWAKEHLECFMPECADRRLTTVARASKRDGFTHRPGAGGHSPEGLFHQQAKALIAKWVTERRPEVRVVLEQATAARTRRADVMLTWPDARQVAVEVQYAPLTVHAWQCRHRSYREQGITPVWLLGHLRSHLRHARGVLAASEHAEDVVELSDLHQAMAAEAATVLWINPIEEKVATAWVTAWAHECLTLGCACDGDDLQFTVAPGPSARWGFFTADDLTDCTLTPDGIITPTLRRLADSEVALAAAREADRRRQAPAVAAQRRRDQVAARQKAEDDARRAAALAKDERLRAWMEAERPRHTRAWLASGLREKVVRRYGAVPPLLAADLPHAHGVIAHPEHWHAAMYGDLILGRDEGSRFTVADSYRVLNQHGTSPHPDDAGARARAVITFLDHLAEHGLLRKHLVRGSAWRIDSYEVIGDIDAAPRRRAERAAHEARVESRRQERKEKVRAAQQRRETWKRREAQRIATARSAASALPATSTPNSPPRGDSTAREAGPRHTQCRVCGGALDEALASAGRHILC